MRRPAAGCRTAGEKAMQSVNINAGAGRNAQGRLHRFAGVAAVVAGALVCGVAAAQTGDVGGVANRVASQFDSLADLLGAAAFLAGVGFVVFGIFKFYNYSKNPQDPQNKVGSAVMLVVAGAMMIAVPTVAGVGVVSIFGTGAETVSVEQGKPNLQSILK